MMEEADSAVRGLNSELKPVMVTLLSALALSM